MVELVVRDRFHIDKVSDADGRGGLEMPYVDGLVTECEPDDGRVEALDCSMPPGRFSRVSGPW